MLLADVSWPRGVTAMKVCGEISEVISVNHPAGDLLQLKFSPFQISSALYPKNTIMCFQ